MLEELSFRSTWQCAKHAICDANYQENIIFIANHNRLIAEKGFLERIEQSRVILAGSKFLLLGMEPRMGHFPGY